MHEVPKSLCHTICAAKMAPRCTMSANSQHPSYLTSLGDQMLSSPWADTGLPSHFIFGCQESSILTSPNIVNHDDVVSQENLSTDPSIQCTFKVHCYYFPKTTDLISSFYIIGNSLNHNNLISKIRIWTFIIFFPLMFLDDFIPENLQKGKFFN